MINWLFKYFSNLHKNITKRQLVVSNIFCNFYISTSSDLVFLIFLRQSSLATILNVTRNIFQRDIWVFERLSQTDFSLFLSFSFPRLRVPVFYDRYTEESFSITITMLDSRRSAREIASAEQKRDSEGAGVKNRRF